MNTFKCGETNESKNEMVRHSWNYCAFNIKLYNFDQIAYTKVPIQGNTK